MARGEELLSRLGLSDFRLRLRGSDALLQVREEQMDLAHSILPQVRTQLAADFRDIAIDSTPRPSRET